jgi:hypothetical protein
MKHAGKIPISHFPQLFDSDVSPTKVPPLFSNLQNSNYGDAKDIESDECIALSDPTSNESSGIDHTPCFSSGPPWQLVAEADIAESAARSCLFQSQVSETFPCNISIRFTVRDLGECPESEESACTSPVLTPSSSTMSLKSLCDEAELPGNLYTDYSIPALEISPSLDVPDAEIAGLSLCTTHDDIGLDNNEDNAIDFAEQMVATHGLNIEEATVNRRTNCLNMRSLFQQKQRNNGTRKSHSHGNLHWSPDDEIRKAQSRFRRYGKAIPMTQLDAQGAALRAHPVAFGTKSNLGQIQIDLKKMSHETREKESWRVWLVSLLPKICLASTEDNKCKDRVSRNIPGHFEESEVEEIARPSPAILARVSA